MAKVSVKLGFTFRVGDLSTNRYGRVDLSIDKKLQLSKLLLTIVSKNAEGIHSSHSLGEDIKESINQLLHQGKENSDSDDNVNYKM